MGILSHHIWGWGYSPTPFMEKKYAPPSQLGMGILSHPICRWEYSPTQHREGYTLTPHMGLRIPSNTIYGCVYPPTPYRDGKYPPTTYGIGVLSHPIRRWVYSPTPQTWDSQSVSGQSKCQSVPQGVNLFPRVSIRAQGVNIFEWFF